MSRLLIGARWEHLLCLNYPCPRGLLEPLVPAGTELDPFGDEYYVTLAAWLNCEARFRGFSLPFHQQFEQVALRFYVRRREPTGAWRTGTVAIRELVPRPAVALALRRWFHSPALSLVMSEAIDMVDPARGLVAYFWSVARQKFAITATIRGAPAPPPPASLAEFITDRTWGYARTREGRTLEYHIGHPRWPVWLPESCSVDGPMHMVFGSAFAYLFAAPPASTFVATGGNVSLFAGSLLRPDA